MTWVTRATSHAVERDSCCARARMNHESRAAPSAVPAASPIRMSSAPPAQQRVVPDRSSLRRSTGPAKLVRKTLEIHQLEEALLHRELQVLTKECSIDVLLVRLDHGIAPRHGESIPDSPRV